MHTMMLEVREDFVSTLKNILAQYPTSDVRIKEDAIAEEIAQRVRDIEAGRSRLTSFDDGMEQLRAKIEAKYAHSSDR